MISFTQPKKNPTMKYILTISLLIYSFHLTNAQDTITKKDLKDISFDKKTFLKEVSNRACTCIDSISSFDKSIDAISKEISICIDKEVGAYQMGIKLASIKDLEADAKEVNGKKTIDLTINTNQNSAEYKKYYYEIERYLVANCPSIKSKVNANDRVRNKSMSINSEALRYYNLGLDETKKENYAKSIEYYKKAIAVDHDFAFAYDNMGICHRRLNQYDEAIEAYNKSLKIDPYGTMPLQNIAIVYQYKKEYKKAINAYERLAKIDSKNPEVYYGIGQVYTEYLHDYEKGLDNLCKAYNIYIEQKSPYRTDAEKLIQTIYNQMKKENKEDKFNEILKKHNISTN